MIDQLIAKYIQIRDKKAQVARAQEAEIAKYDDALKRIEAVLAKHLTDAGAEKIGSDAGVAFFSSSRSATVADRDQFFGFLEASGLWHLADIRAAKKQISEYRDEMNDVPPGINWREERVLRVNRA